MNPRAIELNHGEHIVAVVPEHCSGPGWSNQPVWVYIATNDGKYIRDCLHPEEQTPALRNLFGIGEVVCRKLIEAVEVRKILHDTLHLDDLE